MGAAKHAGCDSKLFLSESLLAAVEVGVLEFSDAFRLRYASPLALQLLGLSDVATFPRDGYHLDRALMECVADAGRRSGMVATGTVGGGDGDQLAVTARCLPGASRRRGVSCLLRRATSEAAHSRSRDLELLETMVNAAEDGLWILTGSGVILGINRMAEQLNGLRKEDVVGRSIQELVIEGYFDRSIALEVISKRIGVTRIQILRDGRKLLVSGKPVFSTDGSIKYVVGTERDITDMSRLMARLQEAKSLSERYRMELRAIEMRELEAAEVVARSESMQGVWELAMRCAGVDSPLLLLGETGTGKGVFAKLIHQASARSSGPFLEVNCGAIPEGLMESELFGYAKGAFTGADPKGKVGLVELGHGGTVLLDEIGDLPLVLQVKLLRFLEDGEIRPIGAAKGKRPDVRIIAATHRDLTQMIARGTFRQDLFYRLNVLSIRIPPLRERCEDIPWLVDMMLSRLERKLGKRRITPAALNVISQYPFPGNVRELWNLIERLVITTDAETIDVGDLPVEVSRAAGLAAGALPTGSGTLRQALRTVEAAILKDALERYGTQMAAAKHLGVGQATIARKAKQYGLK